MKTGSTEHIELSALFNWMFTARAGQSMIYALGDIAADRMPNHVGTLSAVADKVMEWERAGYVYAFQRREPPYGCAYIVRCRKPVVGLVA